MKGAVFLLIITISCVCSFPQKQDSTYSHQRIRKFDKPIPRKFVQIHNVSTMPTATKPTVSESELKHVIEENFAEQPLADIKRNCRANQWRDPNGKCRNIEN